MKPLITFALFAYNQERFVREAVEGAFSQTYSPLEIILSDDCSTDTTFQVIQDMVNQYKGSHQIILNRNATNLGIAGHVNQIFKLAHGHLVIFASGDDISLPERSQINYEAWEISNRRSLCIFSDVSTIDKEGKTFEYNRYIHARRKAGTFTEERYSVPELFCGTKPLIVGGAAAWSPRLMELFGPLPENIVNEDEVLALRTACLGSFTHIATPLVKYRLHDNNIHARYPSFAISLAELDQEEARKQLWLVKLLKMHEAFIQDLETAKRKSLINQSCFEQAIKECYKQHNILKIKLEFYTSLFVSKCRILIQLMKLGLPFLELRSFFYRLLPVTVYRLLKLWRNIILDMTPIFRTTKKANFR